MSTIAAPARGRSFVGLIVCVTLGVSMSVLMLRSRSDAQEINLGNEYINRGRSAALTYDFGGEIRLTWDGPNGSEEATVDVRSQDGVMSIVGNDDVIIQGPSRFKKTESGWVRLWSQSPDQPVKAAAEKWDLSVSGGPLIAGRATREVSAERHDTGAVRERRYFDAITGLLLRREQFDVDGNRVRSASFTSITLPPAVPTGQVPKAPARSDSRQPKSIDEVPAGFYVPLGVGDRFALNGAYQRPGGGVQLFYSDGLFSVSIFQQEGTLDRDDLEPGGVDRVIDGHFVHEYELPMGTALVWERGGLVFTSVSDAPDDELTRIVRSFSIESRGFLEKTLDYVLGPLSW